MAVVTPAQAFSVSIGAGFATPRYARWPRSKKLAAMVALTGLLETMTRANGYEYDLAPVRDDSGKLFPRIYRGRTVFGDDDPVPCLSILEGPLPDENPRYADDNNGVRTEQWVLFLQGWAETNKDNPTDPCYAMMACVQRHISRVVQKRQSGLPSYPDVYMLGGAVVSFTIGPGVVRPPQDGVSSRAFFYLPVVLGLPVDVTEPFAA